MKETFDADARKAIERLASEIKKAADDAKTFHMAGQHDDAWQFDDKQSKLLADLFKALGVKI